MHLRNIALVASSVVVLGALVLLLVKVTASADVDIPEEALAEARARYARGQAAQSRRSAPPPPSAAARGAREEANQPPPERRDTSAPSSPAVPLEEAPRELSPREDDLASQRNELRSAYDRGNYEVALEHAKEYLRLRPNDRYVMRVTVTSACAVGDEDTARTFYEQMVEEDRRIERLRCARYGIEF